ncbi:MAG: ABC transporter ATP-binding protein [Bacteroidetes bacterium]|nr:ABC transporter ATP-binding protein [Bacteroidota bacterium]
MAFRLPRIPSLKPGLLGRIMQLALPERKVFAGAVGLTILSSVLAAVYPLFFQHTIDNYVVTADIPGLTLWSGIILALLLSQSLLGFTNAWLAEKIGQDVIFRLRDYVYRHLTSLRLSFFDKTPVGTAVTRTISDIETITELFSAGLITIAGDIFQIVVILFCMFWMNWKLALISLSVLPLLLIAANKFRKGVRDSFQEVRNEVARLNAFLQEHITGMQIVQLFNREKAEMDKFTAINKKHRDANIRGIYYYAVFFPVVELIVAFTLALIVWWGSHGLLAGTTRVGELTAFIMFINLFFRPVRAIADRFNNIQMGMIAAERIFALTDDAANIETGGTFKPQTLRGEIEFRNISFAYNEEKQVLQNLSFTAEAGKTLAIVGHTGSGKTTLINLVSRFYTPLSGEILLDGKPVESYDLAWLRSRIAVVLQDVFLFSGSITDNVRLRNPEITAEQIRQAAQTIGAYDFISHLPGGFDFNVMERGLSLSLGQRQLVSFIRALAFDPSVIVLDEATSSIDSETEALIQNAIATLLRDRTALVIAHRLSTIRNAHKILLLDNGMKKEEGTHETLMAAGGLYRQMVEKQQAVELSH